MKIVCLGDAFCDVLVANVAKLPSWGQDASCDAISFEAGGSALNTAVHLKSLKPDWTVEFFGCIGDDVGGNLVSQHCAKHRVGMNATTRKDMATGTCIVLSGSADRAFVSNGGACASWDVAEVPVERVAKDAHHLHIGGLFNMITLAPKLASLIERIRAANKQITISMDTGFDSASVWGRDYMELLLGQIDVIKINEVEALGISNEKTLEAALSWFASRVRMLAIITLGEKGALATPHSDLDELIRIPTAKVPSVVDPTGAGDAFNAGFLASFMTDFDLDMALKYACACGTLNVTRIGASKQPVVHTDISLLTVEEVGQDESMVCRLS